MHRIIIGAGSGYFVGILAIAIASNGYDTSRSFLFLDPSGGYMFEIFGPILVGAAMGRAWDKIVKG